jgi:hypothetical protein
MDSKAAALGRFCRTHHVEILYAFGSRAKQALSSANGSSPGGVGRGSDVDIGARIAIDARVDVREKSLMALELEELFEAPRVDLVFLHEADPFLAANIIRGERLFTTDEYAADEYELYIFRRAGDCAPLERERLALIEGS